MADRTPTPRNLDTGGDAMTNPVPTCAAPGDNHSPDLIAVHSGNPAPVILCGYHEMNRPTQ